MIERKHIFLLGVGRTGSKIYRQVFEQDGGIGVLSEIKFKRRWEPDVEDLFSQSHSPQEFVSRLQRGGVRGTFWDDTDLLSSEESREMLAGAIEEQSPEDSSQLLDCILDWFADQKDAKRIVLKFPVHVSYMPWVRESFPKASIVHLVRDPRAATLSHVRRMTNPLRDGHLYRSLTSRGSPSSSSTR